MSSPARGPSPLALLKRRRQKTPHEVGAFRVGGLVFLLLLTTALPARVLGQAVPWSTSIAASPDATPLPEDCGAPGLAQTLNKLRTWASLMMIVAHPDDEDGGMMTLVSRGLGARTTLFTLTRGEGGQNAMSADTYDALGLIRTNELLRADQFSGSEQLWGHFADYGFSKTKEEALQQWNHDQVLYDVVRAVRTVRPLVLTSVFTGGITDGHGHHQVSGEMAQEAFLAAGDPSVFPDQIAAGLRPWKPLAVFERTPFAPVTSQGMFDYATGKFAPTRFYNYVTRQWSTTTPSADITISEGAFDPVLGRSYLQMAREGWGEQRSQYGGGTPPLPGPSDVTYHRYASLLPPPTLTTPNPTFFTGIDTTLPGLATLAHSGDTAFLTAALREIDRHITRAFEGYTPTAPERIAPDLHDAYLQTQSLLAAIDSSSLGDDDKANLTHELTIKLTQLNTALIEALGIEVRALLTPTPKSDASGTDLFTLYPSPTRTHVTPGETFEVRLHVTAAAGWGSGRLLQLARTSLTTPPSERWQVARLAAPGLDTAVSSVGDALFRIEVPHTAAPTEPYFSRTSIAQAVYTVSRPELLGQSTTPYPVSGWADFSYNGVPLRLGQIVQTAHRVHGRGLVYEPLVVTPELSVSLTDHVAILLPGHPSFPVTATVTNESPGKATGTLTLGLPSGWQAEPSSTPLTLAPGEARTETFTLTPKSHPQHSSTASLVSASFTSGNSTFSRGLQTIGYEGLRPANLYRPATLLAQPVDAHFTPNLRIAYIMGTGDEVPAAIAQLGSPPHLLAPADLATADLTRYDTIVLGVRAYTAVPALAQATPRLLAWVHAGGTLVVQYQAAADFNHNYAPYPLSVGTERVIDEAAPVRLLAPSDPLLTTPNRITAADFAGWLEERGHGFASTWDPHFTAPTQTADPGQDPQSGGLLTAAYGQGRYIYLAYALYRQLPEGVPGAWRLLANLLSAGHAAMPPHLDTPR